jgi:D-serine deaminase-like pyridoxal phosphate-dependent protein
MKLPRVQFLNEDNFKQISQSEEHLVVECSEFEKYTTGDVCYVIPIHICPTVIKYKNAITVINNEVTGSWKVAARDH